MKSIPSLRAILAVSASILAGAAFASTPAATSAMLPPEHQAGDISYLSGGIGHDEARAMERAARNYPLELVFVAKSGKHDEYLADLPVTIEDAHHHVVFQGRSEGPYFLARLPKGRYVVRATQEHREFVRHVTVGRQPQRIVFEWKRAPERRHA